jgi:hypothetical protein
MSHSRFGCREEVDSRLLVVGSQIASLTPGPSFAHNLSCRCPNDQCEAILDIYISRPFQWHQKHPNARCFAFCCWTLNIWESRGLQVPNFGSVSFILTLGQSGVATIDYLLLEGWRPLSRAKFVWRSLFVCCLKSGDHQAWQNPSNAYET